MQITAVSLLNADGSALSATIDGAVLVFSSKVENGAVVIRGDGSLQSAVTSWLNAGNRPAPFVAEQNDVPPAVEMWQAKAALRSVDLYDAADAAITASGNIALQSIWIDGNTVRRDSPAIAAIGAALGLTSEGIDLLFVAAAQMQV